MNKVLCLLLSAFLLVSCNMLKDAGKVSLFPSKGLEAVQILTPQPATADSAGAKTSRSHEQSPQVAATENHSLSHQAVNHKRAVLGRRKAWFTSLPKQIRGFQNVLRQPLSESHVSRAHQAMTMDYAQVSSFFLVAGTVVIMIAELIDPALLFTIGITLACLALFIVGIILFWLWTRHKDNSAPWGISYGEYALMFLLGGLASFFFGGIILYYFSFLLLAGALVTFILWLKHLKDEV